MTVRQHRTVLSLALLAGILAIAVGLVSLYHLGVAHAQGSGAIGSGYDIAPPAPSAAVPDPTVKAASDVADLGTILVQYGPIWGAAILVFAIWGGFLKKNESKHWIAQGRTLAMITTAGMGLGALLKWKLGGGVAAGAGMTPILGALKLFNPLGPAATGSTTPAAKGTSAALVLIFGGALGFAAISQPACKGPVPIPVSDLIDCTKAEGSADWATIVAKLEPDALSGNWAQLVVDVTAIAPTAALHLVECVGEELIQQYTVVKQGDLASVNNAKAAAEQIRAHDSTGKPYAYHTKLGNL